MAAPIVLAVDIDAPADTILEAISTSSGLASFWTTDCQAEPRIGSIARFGFGGGPKLEMRVDELDPRRRIAWTCLVEFAMTKHWKGTTVSWELTSGNAARTTLLFQHGNWPPDFAQAELASTAYNWALILRALKAYAESGRPQPVFGPQPIGD